MPYELKCLNAVEHRAIADAYYAKKSVTVEERGEGGGGGGGI